MFFSEAHGQFITGLLGAIKSHYGSELMSLALFGSYARGEARRNSDLDLLIILSTPDVASRRKLISDFVRGVESKLDLLGEQLYREGVTMEVSPLILSCSQAKAFNPLYLDMVDACLLIQDRDDFLQGILNQVRQKRTQWGSRKKTMGNQWYWEIKPGLKWHETINYDE